MVKRRLESVFMLCIVNLCVGLCTSEGVIVGICVGCGSVGIPVCVWWWGRKERKSRERAKVKGAEARLCKGEMERHASRGGDFQVSNKLAGRRNVESREWIRSDQAKHDGALCDFVRAYKVYVDSDVFDRFLKNDKVAVMDALNQIHGKLVEVYKRAEVKIDI